MISKHFKLQELVPEEMYLKYGDKCWEFIDSNLIISIDKIKDKFPEGTMTINNWLWGGVRNQSGIRTPKSKYYSYSSMHSWGKAIDAIFSEYSTEEVRQYILDNPDEFPEIKGIELGISWLHCDTRNREDLISFYP